MLSFSVAVVVLEGCMGGFLKMKKNQNISLVKLSSLFTGVESTPCLNYGTVVTQSL